MWGGYTDGASVMAWLHPKRNVINQHQHINFMKMIIILVILCYIGHYGITNNSRFPVRPPFLEGQRETHLLQHPL